jgi:UDP-N-acetylmuramoyl-tripeptide--D-alanyl-D-alanine ligase
LRNITLNIKDLFNIPTATLFNPDDIKPVKNISINSKKIKRNTLFIAIKGNRFDGHDFVKEAIRNGADTILINKKKYSEFEKINVPIITVNSTTKALGDAANIWRKKLNAKVIGITGSSGKTTLKEILAALLSKKYKVNKTELNNNNHIGVPLTIFNTKGTDEILVAEVGTNHPGEIGYSASVLEPDYSIITNIGNSHLKYLQNKKSVWKEKSELFEETLNNNGKVFINFDDPIIKEYYKSNKNFISYGFTGRPKIKGNISGYTDDGLPIVKIKYKSKQLVNTFTLHGEVSAQNYLAAAAIALEMGLSKKQISSGIIKLQLPPHRLNVRQYKNFILIDDTYNANPNSTKAAIELVGRIKSYKSKVVLLGDMLELGKNEITLHKRLRNVIIKNKIDEVFTVGKRMKYLNEVVSKNVTNARHFSKRSALIEFLKNHDLSESVVLFKGSRGMKMEKFVCVIEEKAFS